MAMVASEMALQDAKIEIASENLNRVGIFMGNAIGGWLYGETELRDLYLEGREGVSHLLSFSLVSCRTARTSLYSLTASKGYSKTVVADRASSLMAIAYAAKNLNRGKNDFILAGGMEAPVTPYAIAVLSDLRSIDAKE